MSIEVQCHTPLKSYSIKNSKGAPDGCIDSDVLEFELSPYEIGECRLARVL